MKKGILFGFILFFLTLIPFIPSDTSTGDSSIQVCTYDNDLENV